MLRHIGAKIRLIFPLLIAFSCSSVGALAQNVSVAPTVENILIIYSYQPQFSWTRRTSNRIHEVFGDDFTIQEEYLDTKRFDVETMFEVGFNSIDTKIKKYGKPDLILTFDDNAILFVDRYRDVLFADIPVIFSGVNSKERVIEMAAKPKMTGIYESLSIVQTIDLAIELNHVPLRKLIAMADNTETSKLFMSIIRSYVDTIADVDLEVIDVSTMTFDEAMRRVRGISSPDTAFLYAGFFKDITGETRSTERLSQEFGQSARRPYYSLFDIAITNGATAGYVISAAAIADKAIEFADRYLRGEPVDSIEPSLKSPNVPMIDEPRATEHGLRMEHLPDSTVLLRPIPPFVERYQTAITTAGVVLAAMGFVMGALHFANLRVQNSLRSMNEMLCRKNKQLKGASEEINFQANHDRLTGLPNRLFLETKLSRLNLQNHRDMIWALFQLDIESFQETNDTLGHEIGDRILIGAGKKLLHLVPETGVVARIGCDEFAVLAPFCNAEEAQNFGDQIMKSISVDYADEGKLRPVSVRCGFSVLERLDDLNAHEVLRRSDVAISRAKTIKSSLCEPFLASYDDEYRERRQIADDIVEGLERGEFEPYFQPQISTADGKVIGFEALVRWVHPERGMLPPITFLPIAEKTGVVADIDCMVLEKAAQRVVQWQEAGCSVEHLSVNVSADRLYDQKLMDSVRGINLGDAHLCFEILESIFLDDEDPELDKTLNQLRELGVQVEIDDFGTGHASILGLRRVMPSRLKIAREIVAPLGQDESQKGLISGIVQMGRSVGIELTAEGVETLEQAQMLKALGVDVLQGFYFSRPMAADDAFEYLSKNKHIKFAA